MGNSEACVSLPNVHVSSLQRLLLDQTTIPVNAVLGVKLANDAHPIDSFDNLYFMAIARVHQVKYGPFFEHSSQLYSIATHVQSWSKVNKGLFEMYQASRPCVPSLNRTHTLATQGRGFGQTRGGTTFASRGSDTVGSLDPTRITARQPCRAPRSLSCLRRIHTPAKDTFRPFFVALLEVR